MATAEVDALSLAQLRFLFPFFPEPLLQVFLAGYVEHGDTGLALAQTRTSDIYEQYYPGNRREDGTVRMTEPEYQSYRDYFEATLASINVNPELFRDRFPEILAGDVSPAEFASRVDAIYERVVSQAPELRSFYAQQYGLDLTDSALVASVLDPDIGTQILNRRISIAEVGGEAALRGFGIDLNLANTLVQAGVDRPAAQEFFGQAAAQLPILDVLARRHNDPDDDFDLNEFVAASIFDDQGERQRIRRLVAQERSLFTAGAFNRGRQGELLGLLQR